MKIDDIGFSCKTLHSGILNEDKMHSRCTVGEKSAGSGNMKKVSNNK